MRAGTKKNELHAQSTAVPTDAGLAGLTRGTDPSAPDASLSAAFKRALGAKPEDSHLPGHASAKSNNIARMAKAEKPNAPLRGSPGKTHIGPRSGHK
jgi:hypothetical protein